LNPVISLNSSAQPIYNARSVVTLEWSQKETQIPIVPRDEIRGFDLIVTYRIDIGQAFSQGLLEGYEYSADAVVKLEIVETPSWCYAVLERTTIATNLTRKDSTATKIFIIIDESAPAYTNEGVIKIRTKVAKLGLLEAFDKTYNMKFKPAYLPLISSDLPEFNTKRIDSNKNAVFPIKIKNLGNARTKVILDVENVPEDWQATVTNEVFLDETRGSSATAYLTVIPPKDVGYHYSQKAIKVSMTPVRAENPDEKGEPLYATFIVQNRGFSSSGIENILLILVFVFIAIVAIILIIRKRKQ